MIATWAMVYMLCSRTCVAQYAVTYETRSECVRNLPKQQATALTEKYACIPISKD
jgi:hypothetical protein